MKKYFVKASITFSIFFILNVISYGQDKIVAITMDDLFFAFNDISINKIEEASDSLLKSITRLNVPVTVFINEKSFFNQGEIDQRLSIVNKWIDNSLVTLGNHTYNHLNYADSGLELFEEDIIKNEALTEELLKKADKDFKYFRFPFNCTCKDSLSKAMVYKFLNHKGYTVTPFTIESSDYMYNSLYCNFIKEGNLNKANDIKEQYIDFTVALFKYYEDLANELYGRNIKHIFLCHTNLLNSVCLGKIIIRLKEKGYSFISLEKALEDKVYQNRDYYNEKYGISWIYRWIENKEERKKLLRKEPYSKEIEQLYNNLTIQH